MKKITAGILLGLLSFIALTGCGKGDKEASGENVTAEENGEVAETEIPAKKIAVFFEGSSSEEMQKVESLFVKELSEKGTDTYDVQFFYAEDDAKLQCEQIEKVLAGEDEGSDDEKKAEVILVEPVDEYGLSECLELAKTQEIPVISYEDLIMDTDAVSYYVTYSYREMGNMIGEAIKKEKNLDKAREEQTSYTIEFLMGSQDHIEALFFYNGVMEVLKEYLDDGTLICPSAKLSFDDTGVLRWDGKQAQKRLERILDTVYTDGSLPDIICTGFDDAAEGAVKALREKNILPENEQYPMITGAGSTSDYLETIAAGEQYCTVYLDQKALVEICAQMTAICADGDTPEVNDKSQFDNGVKIIGTNVCEAKLITAENNGKEAGKESDMEIEEETDTENQGDEEDWEEVDVENDEEEDEETNEE